MARFTPRFGHTHGNGACRDCRVGLHSDDCAYRANDGVGPFGSFICLPCAVRRGIITTAAHCG
jgi:hypothetical protein